MESCSPVVKPKNKLVQIIYLVGIARITEMSNRRPVVKMLQNKGFIKLQ